MSLSSKNKPIKSGVMARYDEDDYSIEVEPDALPASIRRTDPVKHRTVVWENPSIRQTAPV